MRRALAPALLLALGLLAPTSAYAAPANAPAKASHQASRAAAAPTVVKVVRPVTADGSPAPGWKVKRENTTVDCDGPAPSAVDPGIATCWPSAAYLPSCWQSQDHTALCLRAVNRKRLVRVDYRGAWPSEPAPATPAPQGLVLGGDQRCDLRIGGGWGSPPQHPMWMGFYSCEKGSVYAPGRLPDGIDRSADAWTVHLWREKADRIVTKPVLKAVVVGNAA